MSKHDQLSFDFTALPQLLTPDEIYDHPSVDRLIRTLKEDRRIERKPPGYACSSLGDYFSMWANTAPDGGIIVVGIEDNGAVTGCKHLGTERINKLEQSAHVYCPDARVKCKQLVITNTKGQQDFVEMFKVDFRQDKVVQTVNGTACVRIGDQKHTLKDDEIKELAIDRGQTLLEDEPVNLKYPDDFDLTLVKRFVDNFCVIQPDAVGLPDTKILTLRRLGKIANGVFKPNIACTLAFAKDPVSLFSGCQVHFLRYQGEVEQGVDNIIKNQTFEGPVPVLVDAAATMLESQLRQFSRVGADGRFYTADEYPREAWFEGLVNAVVHRSYGQRTMKVFIRMFDDHLEIESPGGFMPMVTAENIFDSHVPRNPRLMNAMNIIGLTREINEGTRRIRRTMAEMRLPPPEFAQIQGAGIPAKVSLTLRNNHNQRRAWVDADVGKILGEAIAATLTTNERTVVNYVAENGSINVTQCLHLIPMLGRWHNAKMLLSSLVKRNVLISHHSETWLRDSQACYTLPGHAPPQRGKKGK